LRNVTLTTGARRINVPGDTAASTETVTLHWRVHTVAYISPVPVDWISQLPAFFPNAEIHVIVSVPRHGDYDLNWINAEGTEAIRVTVEAGDAEPDNTAMSSEGREDWDEADWDIYGEAMSEAVEPDI
jgi:hypothetical protein